MRTFGIIFLLIAIQTTGYAQNARVTLQMKNATIENVLKEIEKQTEYLFFHEAGLIKISDIVDVSWNSKPVSEALNELLVWRGIAYRLVDRQIVLNINEVESQPKISNLTLSGQRYISGCITDAENGEPLIGASVFIANTTVGAITDLNGNYRLEIPGEGSYRLTVAYTGYQTVFKDIEPGDASVVYDIVMDITTIALEEVTVAAKVRFRQQDINLFWRTILGKNPSKKTIYAVNPETVFYYYNSETKVLTVTCRVPLQIINNETGYYIQLVFDHFTHDYNTNISSWKYEYLFSELEPENTKEKTAWEKNRKKIYQTSMTNFIKSLYNKELMENGFLLTYPNRLDAANNLRNSYETFNSFVSVNFLDGSKTLHIPTDLKDLMLICFGHPISRTDLDGVEKAQNNSLKWSLIGLFRNMLQTPEPVRIFPDGTYSNSLMLNVCFSSSSLLGLNTKLPINYIPDIDSKVPVTDVVFKGEELEKRFEQQLEVYPQEKIHLHTDRNFYVPGENIWFKAYVADAHSHLNSTHSQYVYVELISPLDTLVNRVMVRPTDGMFYGHLPLDRIIPEGAYTLRAYTRYMENLGDDYFFKKNIRIGNLAIPKSQNSKPETQNLQDYEVSFFPEGGNLPEGVPSKVAFKALDRNGNAETVTGKLIDETGVEITSVETFHAGMGVFSYIPEAGKRIYLQCSNANGLEKRFELPQPDPKAYSLNVSTQDERLLVRVQSSINAPDVFCYLLAHCRGTVLYFSEWDKRKEGVSFLEDQLPAGVIQFVLFDGQMNPLSERLVFSKNQLAEKVEFQTDKPIYEKRDKVISTLLFNDLTGFNLSGGHFSVAVTDDQDVAVDASITILSSLLLSSELRGYIENPAWYLQDTKESAIALDYLMMTHGWRRYDVAGIVKGNPKRPQISYQTAQEISGQVTGGLFNRSVNEGTVSLLTQGFVMQTITDRNGMFAFRDLEFSNSATFFIQAFNKSGSERVNLAVKDVLFPGLVRTSKSQPLQISPVTTAETIVEPDAFMKKAGQRILYDDNGIRMVQLPEVEITAAPIIKKNEARDKFWANSISDVTLTRELFEKWQPTYVAEYLSAVAGVNVIDAASGLIEIRGANILEPTPPLVLINGIVAQNMNQAAVGDLESIDIFKGPSAALFGSRGAYGVISITTKKGGNIVDKTIKLNSTVYTPLGYQQPVGFYSPKYETYEAKQSPTPDYRTTIFWKPDVVISEDQEEATFEFYTSDFPTVYSVVIEGLSNDGKIIRQVEKIKVE